MSLEATRTPVRGRQPRSGLMCFLCKLMSLMFSALSGKHKRQIFCPYVLLFPALAASEPPLRRQSISLSVHQQADKANFYVLQHTYAKYSPQDLAYTQVNPTFAPLDIKFPARLLTGKSALLPVSGHKRSCLPPESAKLRDFFLHAATRWHSASYDRFKRNSRKFLQNFFAKNLVCVPKVRTFALANQK